MMDAYASRASVPSGTYRQTRDAFTAFALGSAHFALWNELIGRASNHEGLPADGMLADDPVILRDPNTLAKNLKRISSHEDFRALTETSPSIDSATEQLWTFLTGLDDPGRSALDTLLRRAMDPVESLATWPLETLFTRAECERLRQTARPRPAAETVRPRPSPGRGIDVYNGYVCVIAKFTRLCNLRCTYCHDWRAGPNQTMDFSVQANLFEKLLGDPTHGTIDVVWHGGEPTLIGKRGFLRILALQRWFRRPGQIIRNRVQTNATALNPAWIRFLARYGFRVHVSIDGPAEIHDHTRPHANGRSTFAQVSRGLHALQEANLLDYVYLVIGRELLEYGAERIVGFLLQHGITRVGLIPVCPSNGSPQADGPYLDRAEYCRFLVEIERARRARPESWIQVRELDAALRAMRGEMANHCELLGNCVGTFFSVEPDGNVGHCDRYLGDPDYVVGDIVCQTFGEIRAGNRARSLAAENHEATDAQKSCRYFQYCRGWCPHERYLSIRHDPRHDASCCGLSALFEGLEEV